MVIYRSQMWRTFRHSPASCCPDLRRASSPAAADCTSIVRSSIRSSSIYSAPERLRSNPKCWHPHDRRSQRSSSDEHSTQTCFSSAPVAPRNLNSSGQRSPILLGKKRTMEFVFGRCGGHQVLDKKIKTKN